MKYTKEILIATLAIALFFSVKTCNEEKTLKQSATNQLTTKTQYFKNKLGTQTATIETLEIDKKSLKTAILSRDKQLKALSDEFSKVKSIVKWHTRFVYDTIHIKHDSLIPCDFTTYGGYHTKDIEFDYIVNASGLIIEGLTIPNETTLITGFKRKWFLGKQTLTTDITHTNPMIQTSEIQSVQVVIPKPFYDTRLFNIGVGLIGGFLLR